MREVPRTCTSLGDRSFTVAGPRRWNNLPLHLRDSEHTVLEFRQLLKTHLFRGGQRRLVTVAFTMPYKFTFTVYSIFPLFLALVWLAGYHTSGTVSTGMGNHPWASKHSWYVNSDPGELSLAILQLQHLYEFRALNTHAYKRYYFHFAHQ